MATSFGKLGGENAAEFLSGLAVTAEQISFTVHADQRVKLPDPYLERPYLIWKDNLDLARQVNDMLCRERQGECAGTTNRATNRHHTRSTLRTPGKRGE